MFEHLNNNYRDRRTVLIFACVLVSLLSVLVAFYNIRKMNEDIESQIQKTLSFARQSLPLAIWRLDEKYLHHFSDALFLEKKLVCIRIKTDSDVLVNRFRKGFQNRNPNGFSRDNGYYAGATDIFFGKKNIGNIKLIFYRKDIYYHLIVNTSATVFSMTCILVVLLYYFFKLRESENKYKTLYQNAIEGIFRATPQKRFVSANPSMANLLGYETPQELISNISDIENQLYVNPKDRLNLLKKLEKDGRVYGFETQFYKKDGKTIWVSISVQVIRGANNEIRYFDGLIIDVTEKKEREKAERERMAAEESAKAKTTFLANMSHEIRTPMNAVIGLTSLVLKTELSVKQRDYIEKIKNASNTLLKILDDILDFTKIEAGKLAIENVEFNLSMVIGDIYHLFSETIRERDIEFGIFSEPGLPETLIGDPFRLRQVLINLVSNAIKFTEKGEIIIRIQRKSIDCDHQFLPEREWIEFSVKDTGIGIENDKIPLLFQSFTQADSSTARKYGGTGLGLTISGQIVRLMGGKLNIESRVGEGSCFYFSIPFQSCGKKYNISVTPEKQEKPSSLLPVPRVLEGSPKILLVEDNEINQQITREILKSAGYDTDIAPDGLSAIRALENNPYHAVLMDVQMPLMDGYETTRQIRKMSVELKHPGMHIPVCKIPIIAMTAHAMKEDRERCLSSGMDDYVPKPIDEDKLFSALEKATSIHRIFLFGKNEKDRPEPNEYNSEAGTRIPAEQEINSALLYERLNNNETLIKKLIESFLRESESTGRDLMLEIKKENKQKALLLCHRLKGIAGNLSAERLYSYISKIEAWIENSGTQAVDENMLNTIHDILQETILSAKLMNEKLKFRKH